MKTQTAVFYQVCADPQGEPPFKPVTGIMTPDKAAAIKDLQQARIIRPSAYLARVTYIRHTKRTGKKGR